MPALPRRHLLFGGAALAATAAALAISSRAPETAKAAADGTEVTVVRWNSKLHRWAARPIGAAFGAVFLSTNDPDANAPDDPNELAGDVWRRAPGAVT